MYYKEKYEKYERVANDYVFNNIEAKYSNTDEKDEQFKAESLKTLICIHYLLQDIEYLRSGANYWLCLIFIVLCLILYKIWM